MLDRCAQHLIAHRRLVVVATVALATVLRLDNAPISRAVALG